MGLLLLETDLELKLRRALEKTGLKWRSNKCWQEDTCPVNKSRDGAPWGPAGQRGCRATEASAVGSVGSVFGGKGGRLGLGGVVIHTEGPKVQSVASF